jgi:hypothetical protein
LCPIEFVAACGQLRSNVHGGRRAHLKRGTNPNCVASLLEPPPVRFGQSADETDGHRPVDIHPCAAQHDKTAGQREVLGPPRRILFHEHICERRCISCPSPEDSHDNFLTHQSSLVDSRDVDRATLIGPPPGTDWRALAKTRAIIPTAKNSPSSSSTLEAQSPGHPDPARSDPASLPAHISE